MQTIDEVKAHCRDVGQYIEKAFAAGVDEIVGHAFASENHAHLVGAFVSCYLS